MYTLQPKKMLILNILDILRKHSDADHTLSQQEIRRVLYSDLDRNGHMNNSRYLDWTADLLPSDFHRTHSLREMVMCYSNEALEQQQLELNWELTEEGRMQVDIHRPHEGEDYDRIFAARLQYE